MQLVDLLYDILSFFTSTVLEEPQPEQHLDPHPEPHLDSHGGFGVGQSSEQHLERHGGWVVGGKVIGRRVVVVVVSVQHPGLQREPEQHLEPHGDGG